MAAPAIAEKRTAAKAPTFVFILRAGTAEFGVVLVVLAPAELALEAPDVPEDPPEVTVDPKEVLLVAGRVVVTTPVEVVATVVVIDLVVEPAEPTDVVELAPEVEGIGEADGLTPTLNGAEVAKTLLMFPISTASNV